MIKAMTGIVGRVTDLSGDGRLSGNALRRGIAGIVMKAAATGLGFAVAAVLARSLGPHGYGIYSYVYALVLLMAIPAEFGLATLVVRETAKCGAQGRWGTVRGVWLWATSAASVLAVLFAAAGGLLAWIFADRFSTAQLATFGWGLALVPLLALGNLRGAALRGLGRVVTGQLPEGVFRPVFLLAMVAIAVASGRFVSISPDTAMLLHVAAAALTFVVGAILLLRARPAGLRVPSPIQIEGRSWLTAALPLSLMGGMLVINQQVGIVILGVFGTAEEVGVYKVVMQGGVLITFGMQAINTIIAPYFSRYHAQGDTRRLQSIVTASARISLLLALPFMVLFVVWGEPLLRIVFGEHFASGYVALVTLSAGYFISVAIGLANTLLNMTGFERETARSVVVAVIANVLLTLVLTPAWGMNGTALAAVVSFTVWKLQLWMFARRRLGLESAVIRFDGWRRQR